MGSVTNLRYHLVLTTKYRRSVLQGIEQSVYDAFREVEKVSDFKIIGMTTHLVWEREPQHLSRFYWKGKRTLWIGAYFCSTMGDVSDDIVLRYIQNQNSPKKANL